MPERMHGRQPGACGERVDRHTMVCREWIGTDVERVRLALQRFYSGGNLQLASDIARHRFDAQLAGRFLRRLHLQPDIFAGAIADDRQLAQFRHGLVQQLEPLAGQIGLAVRQAGDVAAWTREAAHEPGSHRIPGGGKYYRDRFGRLLGGGHRGGAGGDDDVDAAIDELLRYFAETVRLAVRPAIIDVQIMAVDPTQLAQALHKRPNELAPGRMFGGAQKADGGLPLPTLLFDVSASRHGMPP